MGDTFWLFDTSDFPPRWYCGNWSSALGWLHILSDLAIAAAYLAIPAMLVYFRRRRGDLKLSKLTTLFAAFIIACGSVHLVEAIIFWFPVYRFAGVLKLATAVISLTAAAILLRYMPQVLAIPSLASANRALTEEIQQRKQTEADLHRLKSRYEAILRGTRSIVWTTDPEGNFVIPQASWQRYTGQRWEEHQGHRWLTAIHEEDRPRIEQDWHQALATRTAYTARGRIWHEDSGEYRAFISESVPVIAEDGQVHEWVGTTNDIHDQYTAEAALKAAEADSARQKRELELIYNSAPVGMSLIDRQGRYLRVNPRLAEINGFSPEDHLGRRMQDLLSELWDQVDPIYQRVFETGQPVLNVEVTGRTAASEKERAWLVNYYPLQDTHGQTVAVNSIVVDITSQKEMEKGLRESQQKATQANRAKSEFLANMSHEIRTPMAAILGYADVLLGHLEDPDNRSCVVIIKRNGEHLLHLINDILDLSRIEAGKLEVAAEECLLPELIEEVQALMRVRAEEKQLPLRVRFDGPVPEKVHTDPTRLRQVLINLIGNAIKFTEQGSVEIVVRLDRHASSAMLEMAVIDTGIGISPEQQKALFKPFSQGDTSVTRSYGGSGLGLAISKRLVRMLGGKLTVNSREGEGSTFTVRLPINKVEGADLVQPELESQGTSVPPSETLPLQLDCRVLVVDDRRDVRHISQHFLEKAGAVVAIAEDGQEAVEKVLAAQQDQRSFDVIVMDMQMPRMDGLQATAKLRAAGVSQPIIALTADAMKGDRDRCLQGGCNDYLAKPIDHIQLVAMVARYSGSTTVAVDGASTSGQ